MATTASLPLDLDKPGKYPIVLSDALLGKPSNDVFTGIRYNHKPDPSSQSRPSPLHIKPTSSSSASTYDLSFSDAADNYAYNGTRSAGDGQFVLIFDPEKKHFVLHRVDSEFNMNLVSTPWDQDESSLRSQYPQLEAPAKTQPSPPAPAPTAKSTPTTAQQPAPRKVVKPAKPAAAAKTEIKRRKIEKPKKAKPVREPTPEDADAESDDGLTIEYPGGPPPRKAEYTSTPAFQRTINEDASDDDGDSESEPEPERNQDVDLLKLPSPAGMGEMSDEDIEMHLEAELEQAFKDEVETGGAVDRADESSESEEE